MIFCPNPNCSMGDFDAVGERNRCPLCDMLIGGAECAVCNFRGMGEAGELECSYPMTCLRISD